MTRGDVDKFHSGGTAKLKLGYRGWLALVVAGSYHGLNSSPELSIRLAGN